jgi:hypothetical protein
MRHLLPWLFLFLWVADADADIEQACALSLGSYGNPHEIISEPAIAAEPAVVPCRVPPEDAIAPASDATRKINVRFMMQTDTTEASAVDEKIWGSKPAPLGDSVGGEVRYVAEADGQIEGYAACNKKNQTYEVTNLTFRDPKVAAKLIERVKHLGNAKVPAVRVNLDPSAKQIQALLESQGFSKVDSPGENHVIEMIYRIPPLDPLKSY